MISAWEAAGVPVKSRGASYTGNMLGVMLPLGFRDVKDRVNLRTGAGLEKGDVLLNVTHHTELYIGNEQNVKAARNEHGSATCGESGDQNGREIYVGGYYLPSYGWDYVLRYKPEGEESDDEGSPEEKVTVPGSLPVLNKGDRGISVLAMQAVLIARGFRCGSWGADGDFGTATEQALKMFQAHCKIDADGVCGPVTWAYLLGVKT